MRAVVVRPPAPGATVEEVPAPLLGPDDVHVAVVECGVCGTDLDIVAGKYGRAPAGVPYLILGHENLGRVVEVPPSAPGLAAGDLVVATVRRGCGACPYCRAGRSDFCATGRYTERGIAGAPGYFAQEYGERPEFLVRVPAPLAPIAVLLEPFSVVEKAIAQGEAVRGRVARPSPDGTGVAASALVAGTGAVGMLATLALRSRGYAVTAIDRHDESTVAARVLRTVGARHTNVAEGLAALGADRFDLVLEAAGAPSLAIDLIERLAPNGTLVLTGIPDARTPPLSVPAGALLRGLVLGNRAVVGSVNASHADFEAGLRDLATFESRWPGAVGALLTARRPLAEAPAILAGRDAGSIKTVLTVGTGAGPAPAR